MGEGKDQQQEGAENNKHCGGAGAEIVFCGRVTESGAGLCCVGSAATLETTQQDHRKTVMEGETEKATKLGDKTSREGQLGCRSPLW